MLVATRADADNTIAVNVNDKIAIVLNENPSTGFTWDVGEKANNHDLALACSQFTPDAETAPGAAGHRLFIFRALKPGLVTLRLTLRREWEDASTQKPADEFVIKLDVYPAAKAVPSPETDDDER